MKVSTVGFYLYGWTRKMLKVFQNHLCKISGFLALSLWEEKPSLNMHSKISPLFLNKNFYFQEVMATTPVSSGLITMLPCSWCRRQGVLTRVPTTPDPPACSSCCAWWPEVRRPDLARADCCLRAAFCRMPPCHKRQECGRPLSPTTSYRRRARWSLSKVPSPKQLLWRLPRRLETSAVSLSC